MGTWAHFSQALTTAAQAYASMTGVAPVKRLNHPHDYILAQTIKVVGRLTNRTVDQVCDSVNLEQLGRIVVSGYPTLPVTNDRTFEAERKQQLIEAYLEFLAPELLQETTLVEFHQTYNELEYKYNREVRPAMMALY